MKLNLTHEKFNSNNIDDICRSVYTSSISSANSKSSYSSSMSGSTHSVLKIILLKKNIFLRESLESRELLCTSTFIENADESQYEAIVSAILSDFNIKLVHVKHDSILYLQASEDAIVSVGTSRCVDVKDSKRNLHDIFNMPDFRKFAVQIDGNGDCFMSDLAVKGLLRSLHLQSLRLVEGSVYFLKKRMVEVVEIEKLK